MNTYSFLKFWFFLSVHLHLFLLPILPVYNIGKKVSFNWILLHCPAFTMNMHVWACMLVTHHRKRLLMWVHIHSHFDCFVVVFYQCISRHQSLPWWRKGKSVEETGTSTLYIHSTLNKIQKLQRNNGGFFMVFQGGGESR